MPLQYVGPTNVPDKATVAHKKYVSDAAVSALTQAQADTRIASLLSGYATTMEVDFGDAGASAQAYVQAQDALRVPLAWRGVANGVATLTGAGKVTASQVTLSGSQRLIKKMYSPSAYNGSTVSVTSGSSTLYTVTIADPGYAYRIMAWGYADTNATAGGATLSVRVASSSGTIISRGLSRQSASNWSECTFLPIAAGPVRTGSTVLYFVGTRTGSSGTIQFSNALANTYVHVVPA